MLYTNVYPGSQSKTIPFTSKKKDEEEKRMLILCVHFCFGAVYRLCSLPQNQTELLCTLRQAWIL